MTTKRRKLVFLLVGLALAAALAFFAKEQAPLLTRPTLSPSQVPDTWAAVRESPGHKKHVGEKKLACNKCHDESDGGFRSLKNDACVSCHEKEEARTHAGNVAKPTPCLTCHAFGDKPAPTCLGCHAEAQGKSAAVAVHISKDAPCANCHQPHSERKATQADCASCHNGVTATHGSMHVATDVAHAVQARAMAAAPAVVVAGNHAAAGSCADCHAPHARAVDARASCQGCHENAPRGAKPTGHPACVTCHAPHDLTRAAVKPCAGCHEDRRAAITPGHVACVGCHTPHATANASSSCSTCHAQKVTLGATRVAAHAACASCHKPHDPKAAPGSACVTCHADMAVKHGPGREGKCIDCHSMHPGKGAPLAVSIAGRPAVAVPCTTCHKKASSDSTGHAKGLTCTGCHTPHQFALSKAKGAVCSKCHATETKVALASRGHGDCVKCHNDVHQPTRSAPCATCHAAQASSAPQGHQACQNCHEPHDGHVKPSATCASCHAPEASSKHAHVQGGCATCHKPHGPSGPTGPPGAMPSPACTTCHAPAKLPGLHQLARGNPAGHATCTTCHSSHGPPRDDRVTCTACHEKQKTHQPTATKCNGCHIFRSP